MKNLAIVGGHRDTRDQAPYNSGDFDIWTFNEAPQADWCLRWDACFQLHRPTVYTSPQNWSNKLHWDWLQQDHGDRVIWMQERDARVRNSKRYPLDEIIGSIPGGSMRWFDSSPAYALALAIYQGYEGVELYGMSLASNTEYNYQLRNWNFWVGVALGVGVEVVIKCGKNNDFGNGILYGYNGEVQLSSDVYRAGIADGHYSWDTEERHAKETRSRLDNALLDKRLSAVVELITEVRKAGLASGTAAGVLAEAEAYAARVDFISRQEFEQRAARAQIEGEANRTQMYIEVGKVEYVYNVWKDTYNYEALNQLRKFIDQMYHLAYDTGVKSGIFRSNMAYLQKYDNILTADGGVKTLTSLGVKQDG